MLPTHKGGGMGEGVVVWLDVRMQSGSIQLFGISRVVVLSAGCCGELLYEVLQYCPGLPDPL